MDQRMIASLALLAAILLPAAGMIVAGLVDLARGPYRRRR